MAEHGEWTQKGATLSDATAKKEYGVSTAFIIEGVNAGCLEYREGAIWGNPYIRVLRSQLEKYIVKEKGAAYLKSVKNKTELSAIKKELASLKKRTKELEVRKAALEGTGEKK